MTKRPARQPSASRPARPFPPPAALEGEAQPRQGPDGDAAENWARYAKTAPAGWPELARVTLQRQVAAAAAPPRTQPEFFTELARCGLRVRPSSHRHGEVTGYAVALPGDAAR